MRFPEAASPDDVLAAFDDHCAAHGIAPYPHQEEAALALAAGDHVIITTPTGSGKSLVGLVALAVAFAQGRRGYYTAPIKALVGQKFGELVDAFGTEHVGMLTGDGVINPDAPIIACTTEILAGVALRDGANADVATAVLDEFHFYADPQRGWAWQVPLLELPQTQFVLASATLGEVDFFADDLRKRTSRDVTVITSTARPVPLTYSYSTEPLLDVVDDLIHTGRTPAYLVHFTQAAATDQARALLTALARKPDPRIADAIGGFRFARGFGQTLSRLLRAGIGVHHAGMLPRYRRLVERLAADGLLRVVCGTDTLGVGVNIPIKTVLMTGLAKFDGERDRLLTAREFHQIAGRAGRAGFDTLGEVIVQAPEHVIENRKQLEKAAGDARKVAKIVRKKAPPGKPNWTEATFDRLRDAPPERLTSQLRITHAMTLEFLVGRPDPVAAMARLIADNHEPEPARGTLIRQAVGIYLSLRQAGIVERARLSDDPASPDFHRRTVRLTVDVPRDFALNQDLSLFALAALDLLDPTAETYPLDIVSVIEATLGDPRPVLWAQEKAERAVAVAAMKAEGLEYNQRMAELDKVTYPKPLADLLAAAFETYARSNPWARDFEISPKSVVRMAAERAMTFSELVATFGLQRSEGVVLRYLSDAYRALRRTVPVEHRTPEFDDVVAWLGSIVASVDNSLLEDRASVAEVRPDDTESLEVATLRRLVRGAVFHRLELAQFERWDTLGALDERWDGRWWRERFDGYFDEHADIGIDAKARSLFQLTEDGPTWTATQILDDPDRDHDWRLVASVDVAASLASGDVEFTALDLVNLR